MKELVSEIEIEAPADKVWQILTDFRKYSEWNPFITQINGELKKGAKLEVHLQPPNEKKRWFSIPLFSILKKIRNYAGLVKVEQECLTASTGFS